MIKMVQVTSSRRNWEFIVGNIAIIQEYMDLSILVKEEHALRSKF